MQLLFFQIKMKRTSEQVFFQTLEQIKKIKLNLMDDEIDIARCIQRDDNTIVYDDQLVTDQHYTLKNGQQLISHMKGSEPVESLHPKITPPYDVCFKSDESKIVQNENSITYSKDLVIAKTYDSIVGEYTSTKAIETFQRAARFNIVQNIIINNIQADDSYVPTVTMVESLGPDILSKFLFCYERGAFIYNDETGVWKSVSSSEQAKELYNICRMRILQNEKMKKYLGKFPRNDFKAAIEAVCHKQIDTTLDLNKFPLHKYHLQNDKLMRNASSHRLFTSTGWEYSKDDSIKYKDELDNFIHKLFPNDVEKNVMLSFCKGFLHGNRNEKKFLILTDNRGGNNGKSTWVNFLCSFLGNLALNNTRLFLKTQIQDKNGQDCILWKIHNKRLIVGSEFKPDMKLDVSMMKKLTGMDPISGRHFHNEGDFEFVSQANVIMVYNEGDGPIEDLGDEAFQDRKLVLRLQSKFIKNQLNDDWETLTFPREIINYKLFFSSFLDLLRNHVMTELKESGDMIRAKEQDSEIQKELIEFLENNSRFTGNKKDFIKLKDLWNKFKGIKWREFRIQSIKYFERRGGVYKENYVPKFNGKQCRMSHIILFYQLVTINS